MDSTVRGWLPFLLVERRIATIMREENSMKKLIKGILMSFPWWHDEQLSEQEVKKLANNLSKEIQKQDVLPLIIAIILIVIIAAIFLLR